MSRAIFSMDLACFRSSKLCHREWRTLGFRHSSEAAKQRKRQCFPSMSLPVNRLERLKHSLAKGQVHPAGNEKVPIAFESLELPCPKNSLVLSRIGKTLVYHRKIVNGKVILFALTDFICSGTMFAHRVGWHEFCTGK